MSDSSGTWEWEPVPELSFPGLIFTVAKRGSYVSQPRC
jgi:hypothetical protein